MTIIKSPYPSIQIPVVDLPTGLLLNPLGSNPSKRNDIAMILHETGEKLTYGELESNVLKLSAGLKNMGVRRGCVVQMFGASGPEFPQIVWATLHCGGVITTANPVYTADELAYQLSDSQPSYIFTTPDLLPTALIAAAQAGISANCICTYHERCTGHKFWTDLFVDAHDAPRITWTEDDIKRKPAFIIYSSGTTGKPKGVLLSHYNVTANISQWKSLYPVSSKYQVAIFPMYHAAGLLAVQTMLSDGNTLIVTRKFSFTRLCQIIQDYKITEIGASPPIIVMLAKSPLTKEYNLSSLRSVISGAAPLSQSLSLEVGQKYNLTSKFVGDRWGQTELSRTGLITAAHVKPKLGSVGMVLPNSEAKLIDEEGREVDGPNKPGEMYYRGPNVAIGYLNRPDATRETFLEDGFLRTGDQAIYDEEGYFFIVDRLKDLIKVNALQVAPAEIESHLLAHPAIADCAVIPTPDDFSGELPLAFIVLKDASLQSVSLAHEIMKFVDERVAIHKRLRGGIVWCDEVPKNASGKILRRVLRDMKGVSVVEYYGGRSGRVAKL
ncbi:hypothetical protein SmJEL517_g03493 [Synchytrium microbalum]|uniref:4-coumarate--CoA ligase n=1 Tax=Synchytrium microbalum TaxID=1806994 RepID=A0A507C827_9FUNG|nr:uncharacterized protein SmJEL517_g03493 [Synchytrium microbalum]TPX33683.1 hypothetical protein SmJEL517_g03493 [Synchytrium microbalum]